MYKENLVYELTNRRIELKQLISSIDEKMPSYRRGSLFVKNNYYYIKYYELGKTVSEYLGKDLSLDKIERIKQELRNYKTLKSRKSEYVKELNEIEKMITHYGGKL